MPGLRSVAIQEFIARYIYDQHFAEDDGIPPKRLIQLLRDEFCSHGVRNAGREKKEMADIVRSMVSQGILERVDRVDVGRAYLKLNPDFNVRALVRLPESRESSMELERTEEPVSVLTLEERTIEEDVPMVEKSDADMHAEAYAEMIRGAMPMVRQPTPTNFLEPHYPVLPVEASQGEVNVGRLAQKEDTPEATAPDDTQEEADQRAIHRIEALAEETRIQEILAEQMRQEEMQEAEIQQDQDQPEEMVHDFPHQNIRQDEIQDEEMVDADLPEAHTEGSLHTRVNFDDLPQKPLVEVQPEATLEGAIAPEVPDPTQHEAGQQGYQSETCGQSIQLEETSSINKLSTDEQPEVSQPEEEPRKVTPAEISKPAQLDSELNGVSLKIMQGESTDPCAKSPLQVLQATPEVQNEHPSGEVDLPEAMQVEHVVTSNQALLGIQRGYTSESQIIQPEQPCDKLSEPAEKIDEVQLDNDLISSLETQPEHSPSATQDMQQMQPERQSEELREPGQIQPEETWQKVAITSTSEAQLEQVGSIGPEAEHIQPEKSHQSVDEILEGTQRNPEAEMTLAVKNIVSDTQTDMLNSVTEVQENLHARAPALAAGSSSNTEQEGAIAVVSGTKRDSVSAQPETSLDSGLHHESPSGDRADCSHEISEEALSRPQHSFGTTEPATESIPSAKIDSLAQDHTQSPNLVSSSDMLEFQQFLEYKRRQAQMMSPAESMQDLRPGNSSSTPVTEKHTQNPPSGVRPPLNSGTLPGVGEHALELESEAHADAESTIEVDVDTRMGDDTELDSSQPILTPSRKRPRVMEIAPSDTSDSHDPVSPMHSSHSTPHSRPSKRVCTPLSDSRRRSVISRMSPMGSGSPFVMQDRPIGRPPLPFKNEKKPDNSAPALKHAVQNLREKYPEDDFETDNGKIMCLDCERDFTAQQYPSGGYNVNGFKTHLNGKPHKDLRNKRLEKASRAASYAPTSYAPSASAGYINAAFDSSIQPKAIDELVDKEVRLVASLEDQLHKAKQHVASVKLFRDHNLISQFTLLEASAQERFSKIDSSQEATRRDLRDLQDQISSALNSFEEKNQSQMSELGERVSSAQLSFTEAQDSIREVKEQIDDVGRKTSTECKEMFDRIARSEVRNNERIEKQGLDNERLAGQVTKVEHKSRSRINDIIARMEVLEKMVATRDGSIQELKVQNNSLSRQLQQQRRDMQAFQKSMEDQMGAYTNHLATMEGQMIYKMKSHAQHANDHTDKLEGQMAARARETSQHKAQTDMNIAEMKREFTSRLGMIQEKFLERVNDLEKKHYGRIKKLEGKVSEQQGHIERCDAVVPTLFTEGQELRGFCEEFRESLVGLAGQIATIGGVQEKKAYKSRKPLGVLEQHNGNVQKEDRRSVKTSAAP